MKSISIKLGIGKRFSLISAIIVVILVIIFSSIFFLNSRHNKTVNMESIVLGITPLSENSIPFFVANDQHFFSRNGLKVALKYYDMGKKIVNAMQKGDVDVASAVSEYVLAGKALNKEKISTIGSYDKEETSLIMARSDCGIKDISDLAGKRIGVIRGTILEFYLGRFLQLNDIDIENVKIVNMAKNPQSVKAINNGDVDAVIAFPPYSETIKEQLRNKLVVWQAQSSKPTYDLLVCRNEWIIEHPELVERFLKTINQAEEYMVRHKDEVRAIMKKRFNYTDNLIEKELLQSNYSLSLDQSLVSAMEDEARWMIKNNLTSEKKTPDFLNFIYLDGLEKVKPESVNIIR